MLEEKYRRLIGRVELRETLSSLRSDIKEPLHRQELKRLAGDGEALFFLLSEKDAKTRKNAALLFGELPLMTAAEPLVDAYRSEETLFVKSAYLISLRKLRADGHSDFFRERLQKLKSEEVPADARKHIDEEIKELTALLFEREGGGKHVFTGFAKPHTFLLTTNREQREVTRNEMQSIPDTTGRRADLHPLGVAVVSKELLPFVNLRTYRELLFPVKTKSAITEQPLKAAELLWESGIYAFLQECHNGRDTFAFRLDVKRQAAPSGRPAEESALSEREKADVTFVKKLAGELERISGWVLFNDPKNYELEIRLIKTKSGDYAAFLKLFTIPVKRFSYRKNTIAQSIHPAAAAMMMQLAKPYLKERAQILDPCCGVGTMLIERDLCVPAGDKYGIDVFGEAIEKARENASLAGERIHFIRRDFLDFRHDYKFDEIVSNLPTGARRTRAETDEFYRCFFEKAKSLLKSDGIMILYTNEEGIVKKRLRLMPEYRLLQEFLIRKKDNFHLYIIRMKG